MDNLKLPEYRTRYRTKRELRDRKSEEVIRETINWVAKLDPNDPKFEHHLLEALWVTAGADKVDQQLLKRLLTAKDYRVRAAAVPMSIWPYP